ncbi:gamma-butyrobetaine hydroxylase-like domain-containing protein [Thalassotalea ponticola]|uniref:gamma-butyrobetaine hydroxylase-like domain-containing protein n=1 Tax=Thalassotalea ponticola TaxID=1523392 RepID=UPI0025B5A059|nr:gamma-butyrobetaine hydroxylase-like domain-containing protein [Thalassotalea ponticola]MDN3653753.1 gamma-butyrobetaine hydroxylase-like domain-containing protein [Thalassotalea ponticola]
MITSIQLNHRTKMLYLHFDDGFEQQLSYEFLRCYSPSEQSNKANANKPPVSNKKQVVVRAVEPLGKHGFRLHFDDQHEAVYSAQLLSEYAHNRERLWQHYVHQLHAHGLSREALIEIKQV